MRRTKDLSQTLTTQTFQNSLIKEYTLNHNRDPYYDLKFKVYSLIKGFWKVWVDQAVSSFSFWVQAVPSSVKNFTGLQMILRGRAARE